MDKCSKWRWENTVSSFWMNYLDVLVKVLEEKYVKLWMV